MKHSLVASSSKYNHIKSYLYYCRLHHLCLERLQKCIDVQLYVQLLWIIGGRLAIAGVLHHRICLTHWGRVTDICVGNLTITGSDNGLSPWRRQAIIWTNGAVLLIGPLGTNFSQILIEMSICSFTKMHLEMPSGKWRPFCLGLNVLNHPPQTIRPRMVSSLWLCLWYIRTTSIFAYGGPSSLVGVGELIWWAGTWHYVFPFQPKNGWPTYFYQACQIVLATGMDKAATWDPCCQVVGGWRAVCGWYLCDFNWYRCWYMQVDYGDSVPPAQVQPGS